MRSAAEFLRHRLRLRRRLILSPPSSSPFSRSVPLQNPNPLPYSNLSNRRQLSGTSHLHPNPSFPSLSTDFSRRSFSWIAWSRSPDKSDADNTTKSSENGSEFSSIDGCQSGSEASNLGLHGSGIMEESSGEDGRSDANANSSEIGSDFGSIDEFGGNGSEVSNMGIVGESVGEMAWYHPVRAVVSMLDGFHDFTGLPWWLVISVSTLALRASLFPVLVLQLKKAGRIVELLPKLPPPMPPPLSGRSFREQYLLFEKKRRELGCPSYLWTFAYFTVQFPCFLLWMTSIRRMCLDHHPGFDSGGTLWFQNLTDFPHGLLGLTFPVMIAGLHYINVQVSFRNLKFDTLPGIFGLLAKYYKLYLDILAFPLLFIGLHIPQGSLVYWVTNSSLTLIQQLSLKNTYIRSKLRLPKEKVLMKKKIPEGTAAVLEDGSSLLHETSVEALSPEKLLDLALEEIAGGHLDKALPLLRLAIEKDPKLVRALIALGQTLCSKGLFEEAAGYFERAISNIQQEEDSSILVLASFGAGVSRIWQGRKSEGIQHLKRIAELKEPESPMDKACYYQGLVMLGSTLFGEGEKSEAAKYLRRAAAYDPAVNAYVKECEEG